MRIAIAVTVGAMLLSGCQSEVAQNEAAARNEAGLNEASAMIGENEPGEEVLPLPPGCDVAQDHRWAAWYDHTATGPRTVSAMGLWKMGRGGYRYELKPVPIDPAQPGVQLFDLTTRAPQIGPTVVTQYAPRGKVAAPNDLTSVVITCNGRGELRRISSIAHEIPIGFNPDGPAEQAATQ